MSAADYFSQVQKVYVAYYGRPADPSGQYYWATRLDGAGGNLSSIIDAFGTSAESTALYAGADNAAKVTAIYQQLFNRAPEAAGLAFYTTELGAGRMTAASIALNVANGAQGTDATYLANKLTVASAFTDALNIDSAGAVAYAGTSAATAARSLISGITNAAVTTNVASTIASIKSSGATEEGLTFTLTTGDDTFVGTTGNDTFDATTKTLSVDDRISDASTTDSDTMNIGATADPAVMNVTNVENINIDWQAYSTPDVDLDDVTGATVTISSSSNGFQGHANVTNAGSNDLVFGTGMAGSIDVTTAEDMTITANLASSVVVSSGDGALTIVANAADSIVVTGGDEVTVTAADASSIDISGGNADVVTLNVGSDVEIELNGDDAADVTINSDEDITVTLSGGGAGFGTMGVGGAGAITLAFGDDQDASGAEVTGFAAIELSPTATTDLSGVDADTEIVLASGGSDNLLLNDEATVTLQSGSVTLLAASDAGANTVNVTLEASGSTISFTSGGGSGDFEAAVITMDTGFDGDSLDFSGSGAGEYTIISADEDVSVVVNVDAYTDNDGNGDAERTVDLTQVAGAVEFNDLDGSGDISVIGGDGVLTANVRGASARTFTVVGGDGGIVVGDSDASGSGAVVFSGGTLTVIGADADDEVTIDDISSGGTATLLLGNGDNSVSVSGSAVLGASGGTDDAVLTITTGIGDDTVTFESQLVMVTGGTGSGSSVITIDLGAGDDTISLDSGADLSSGGVITLTNVETLDFDRDGADDTTVLGSFFDGKSFTLSGVGGGANDSGGSGAGLSGASGGQITVLLASGGDTVDFSGLEIDGVGGLFIDTTVLNTSGGGDYTVVASAGDDDFLMSATSGGDYDITMGKGIDEIWLSGGGAGEFASATIQLAVGDSAAVAGEIDVVDVASGDIVSGDIVFDFNLAAATNSNFELSSGDANVSGDATAITAATAAFAADTSLKYYVTGDGTDGWLFVNSKSGSAPEIAVKITGLGSTDNFTIDNISS